MRNKIYIIIALGWMVFPFLKAQEISGELTLEKAIGIAMTNNYDLKIAENQLLQAKNNNSIGNAGLWPSVSINGGLDYSESDIETETESTGVLTYDGVGATVYSGNARVDYALFDGFGNKYNYKKLQQLDEQQQIFFQQQMENTMLDVVDAYYNVCSAQQNLKLAKESMAISKERYQKAVDKRTYGQANKLDVLNAEVDMNSDSTNILNAEQYCVTAIKDLNVVLGVPVNSAYSVDEKIEFTKNFTADEVISATMVRNSMLQSQQKQEEITQMDLKITQSGKYPKLSAYGKYAYSNTDYSDYATVYSQSSGPSAGLSLSFNVFNGNQQRTREKNAKLNILSEQERTQQIKSRLERDASNAYTDYTYKKRIVDLQQRSLVQAELNFEQTKEMFKLGSVTSIEFRTAQQNMLNVANNYNDARFNAKVAEYNLLRITGELVK
ncbi:TolC family protein [Saccharicrinis sp. GN24d3]|uniref:TolC family protein n=1 Tax=Saccharicrinis sp. GN24d3 TaxID=3458416 RepID=UPI0040352925